MASPTITIEPQGFTLHPREGETIIQAAWREGYYWPTICEGEGRCGQCQFLAEDGADNLQPPDEAERKVLRWLERVGVAGPLRLACRAVASGDVRIRQEGVRKGL